jgi:C-terminal processing protease CtpA/Prc
MSGENDTSVSLLVRTPAGTTRTLTFTRQWKFNYRSPRAGAVYRVLAGNVGYVDLSRLTVDQVDPMFAALSGTRAIVFDDRGYPNGTAWSIAPRLTNRERVKFSLFEIPLVRNMVSQDDTDAYLPTMISGYDLIPSVPGKSKYLHPTVLLINEQTGSQAEYTGMMFRAADNMEFVGTPTVGADGNVTDFSLPGGLWPYFSGASVRWPDGRQTQRIGLQPDVRVEPTAQDIARGKDVVLLTGLRVALRKAGASNSVVSRSVAEEEGAETTAFFRASAPR